ncbi:COMM domain-containing protein 4 [Arctopsyche grandis]|uniref:COMM domain-containing protein 4 n=1 Tax=Arctopsyche grandis TaxID=121162 RepID=UPI00406D6C00
MDLKCFGGNKCPEWVIAGLFACSKFDAPNAKMICMTIASHAAGESLDEGEIKSTLAKYDMDTIEDVHKVVGSILYVLKTTAKWDSDSAQLAAGMRTIRISNHMIRGLRAAFDEYGAEIASSMRKSPLTLTKLKSVSTSQPPESAIDCIELNLSVEDCINRKTKSHSILLQKEDMADLISELKKARKYME